MPNLKRYYSNREPLKGIFLWSSFIKLLVFVNQVILTLSYTWPASVQKWLPLVSWKSILAVSAQILLF
jgi:hypothetical protein